MLLQLCFVGESQFIILQTGYRVVVGGHQCSRELLVGSRLLLRCAQAVV
jgi:hypothetical protein